MESKMEILKILKKVSGVQAAQDRKQANTIKDDAEKKYFEATEKTERYRIQLNLEINKFGKIRLESLKNTIGKFLSFLKDIDQKNKTNQYDFLTELDIKQDKIKELESLEMSASKILSTTIAASAIGAAALTGVPAIVTGAVTTLATASTGTAISTLSGAAASNAVLAWLGGGSIAAGGGGMAVGTAVLSTLTWTATGGLAIIAAGLIASTHFSKKLTEAENYKKEVDIKVGEMEKSWIVMDGISKRVNELKDVTLSLTQRTVKELLYLEPLIPDFKPSDIYHKEVFQRNGLLVKSIGELARAPIFDENGDLSNDTMIVASKIKTILNTQL